MPIEIDDPRIIAKIEELMRVTGETDFEEAIRIAALERLERIKAKSVEGEPATRPKDQ